MKHFNFAGFEFPRRIPELFPNRKNSAHKMVRGVYFSSPEPLAKGNSCTMFYLDAYKGLNGNFQPGLRWQWADEVECVSINHTGWWIDSYESDKFRGMVFRLPNRRGFLAGYSMGPEMASWIYYDEIYVTPQDAARAADELARYDAERARWSAYEDEEEERKREAAAQSEREMHQQVERQLVQAGWW